MKKVILSLIVLLFITSCWEENDKYKENIDSDKNNKVVNETKKEEVSILDWYELYDDFSVFSFIYPENWDLFVEKWLLKATASFYDNGVFLKSISFLSQDYDSMDIDFDRYYNANLKAIKESFIWKTGELISEESVKESWLNGKKLVYKLSTKDLDMKITQYFFYKSWVSYVITFTNKLWSSFSDIEFENIIKNFKLK